MTEHLLSKLAPSGRVLDRAQYEPLCFSLLDGDVLVRNERYTDPENHEYRVQIENGVPIACECPADEKYPGACKHRVAVAIRSVVVDAAVEMQALADGGSVRASTRYETDESSCDCEQLSNGFPCWECVRTGRRGLPLQE
ncbi:SWIM zinc finger family protein [Haloprofundus sp. MHR1]|uniref:SWIM zinc finger family protein n=1 Tax=Haloprofundus sp. MHR1 TaxID=2572921 RepID=UPI0010BF5C8F|nr:SWIM zinc finger family protein [Haloprofundus sp. MHR1]QCJ45885.1 SWIM zinc finger family protein [Haloprofundus sp. MHR1]